MLSLSFVQRTFYWDVENFLSGEKVVGTGKKFLLESHDFKNNTEVL